MEEPLITFRLQTEGNPQIHAATLLQLLRFLARHRIPIPADAEAHIVLSHHPRRPFCPEDLPTELIEILITDPVEPLDPRLAYKPGPHFGCAVSPVSLIDRTNP